MYKRQVQGGAFVYGILLGFFGLGAICGGLLNATIRKRFSNEAIVRGAFIGFGLAPMMPVSYTHLDVYKRQQLRTPGGGTIAIS